MTTPKARPFALPPLESLWPTLTLLAATLALLYGTAASMVGIWIRSETFTHAFLVPPISLWLIWRRRDRLAALPSRPLPWMLLPIAAACLVWVLGELATVNAASQFALVTLVVLAVPLLFGWAIARELMFPLAFLYFALPFGEFLVPQLMEWTADFTVLALRASGIPVYREGLQFVIPSGNWSVVQACSGVRYLIASFMVGTLFAYLNYRSSRRRLLFVGVTLAVPLLANWVRAYLIVMIGHLSGNELATGVDHLIYGWVFFGIVIGLMFLIGARWAEPDEPVAIARAVTRSSTPDAGRMWWVAACAIALLGLAQALMLRAERSSGALPSVELPAVLPGAWVADEVPLADWAPAFRNPSAAWSRVYRKADQRVYLWIGYYQKQNDHRKLISSINGLVTGEDKRWNPLPKGVRKVSMAGTDTVVRATELREAPRLGGTSAKRLLVWHVYRVGDRYVAGDARAKFAQAVNQLRGLGDDGAVLVLATPANGDDDATLQAFAGTAIAPVVHALDTRPVNP